MKNIFFVITGFLLFNTALSQSGNLVFYNQEGNRFFVILNGVKMNSDAQTNVKITNLPQPYYKVKIIFEDKTLGEVDKTLNFNPNTETVFQVRKNNKNEWVVRWQSEVPIAQAAPPALGQTVLIYSPTGINTSVNSPAGNLSTSTTTTTTSNGTVGTNSENVNMNVSVPGINLNMNVNAPVVTSTSTTTTVNTSTSTVDGNTTTIVDNGGHKVYSMPGYNGPVGCSWPMNDQDFANVKQSIASKSFDDTKLTISKQVIASNCLFSRQVKELMLLFSFEATRLEFAKFAYGYTFDIGNYYLLNDAFQFESTIEELNQYINSTKR
jgi:hypothetical protein